MADADYFEGHPIQAAVLVVSYIHANHRESGPYQVKGTSKEIIPQKHRPVVACSGISSSNLQYTEQDRIPVVLLYVSVQEPCPIYYADLRVASQHIRVREGVETVTVHIPEENCTTEDISGIISIIDSYYL